MIDLGTSKWRKIFWAENAGHFFFIVMGILATVFCMERMGTFDSSSYLFNMLSFEEIYYPHQRHGAFLVQILPYLFLKAGASLETVLLVYSLSFIVIYYLCWLFCRYVARHRGAALAIILISVLQVKYTFYWPVTEIFQGLIYSLTAYAWIAGARFKTGLAYYPVALFFIALAILVHPLTVIPLFFAIAYEYLDNKRFRDVRIYVVAGLVVVVWVGFRLVKTPSAYENELMAKVFTIPHVARHFLDLPGPRTFLKNLGSLYILSTFISLAVVAFLTWQRAWLKLLLYGGAFVLIALLINATFPMGNSKVVIENMMLPLSFFTVIVFANEMLPRLKAWRLEYPLLLVIVWFGLTRIISHADFYQYRFDWQDKLGAYLEQFPEQKLMLDDRNMPSKPDHFMVTWAVSPESMVRSSILDPAHPFVLHMGTPEQLDWFRKEPNQQIWVPYAHFWRLRWHEELPKGRIKFEERPLRFANEPDSLDLPTLMRRVTNISATTDLAENYANQSGKRIYLPINLKNGGGEGLSSFLSNPHPVYLSYRILKNGVSVNEEGPLIPLWADLPAGTALTQLIDLYLPPEKGNYLLELSLRTDGNTIRHILVEKEFQL